MEDRQLLIFAAKAAGIEIDDGEFNGGGKGNTGFDLLGNLVVDWHNGETWNPLTDDGDAFRLAVALKINIQFSGDRYSISMRDVFDICCLHGNADRTVDIRRDIVREAARLGAGDTAHKMHN